MKTDRCFHDSICYSTLMIGRCLSPLDSLFQSLLVMGKLQSKYEVLTFRSSTLFTFVSIRH